MPSEHSCFGCHKPFPSLKRLRAHEAKCKVSKRIKIDIAQAHLLHLEMAQTEDAGPCIERPDQLPHNIPIPLPTHIETSESNSNVPEVQAASLMMHDVNLAWVCGMLSLIRQHMFTTSIMIVRQ